MKSNKLKKLLLVTILSISVLSMTGCESISGLIGKVKGNLKGNDYKVTQYDNFGEQVLEVNGKKISIEGIRDKGSELTSYINIAIDGEDWQHVGGTVVFAQDGVDMITDFQLPKEITTEGKGSIGFMPADKFINGYKNKIGRDAVLVVYSQTGSPIGLFQGDSIYYEIPSNLPKTTMISVDGKLVYVHRANIDIMPASLLK